MSIEPPAVFCALILVGGLAAADTKMAFSDLPPAVQEAAKSQIKGAQVRAQVPRKKIARPLRSGNESQRKGPRSELRRGRETIEGGAGDRHQRHSRGGKGIASEESWKWKYSEGGVRHGGYFGQLRSDRYDERRQAR
jgi:hypothetical protein